MFIYPIKCPLMATTYNTHYKFTTLTMGDIPPKMAKIDAQKKGQHKIINIQLTLVISNSMGPWKKFESTVVRLKRSYEDTGSMVCLTTKGRQLERNFEELKPALHVPILGTILNIRCFCCCFFLSVKFFESCETTDNF